MESESFRCASADAYKLALPMIGMLQACGVDTSRMDPFAIWLNEEIFQSHYVIEQRRQELKRGCVLPGTEEVFEALNEFERREIGETLDLRRFFA